MTTRDAVSIDEIAPLTWRVQSALGPRNLYQYILASEEGAVAVVDTGTSATPREAILPGFRRIGISPASVSYVVVTHPDLDHQGGLAGLREVMPRMAACCGFADRGIVENPERLLTDRYGAYEREHGLGYTADEKAWMRDLYGHEETIDNALIGGETIRLGSRSIDVHHAPGHAAGHLMLHEAGVGLLFSSDAIHGAMCPGADGSPALPPTYDDVDRYLETIELIERLSPATLHSGHWPEQHGAAVAAFCTESREFVQRMDAAIAHRLSEPATLRDVCEYVDLTLGPFGADPVNLMFAAHAHVARLMRRGIVDSVGRREPPLRFRVVAEPGVDPPASSSAAE